MNKLKRMLKIMALLAGICLMCAFSVNASAASKLTYPDRAVRSGNYVYYALGNDGVGYIYRYNISTGKKSLFLKQWCYGELFVSGKYLYFTVDNYGSSEARDRYIYRVGLNGKGLKRLANGYSPVVIGNKVYYTGVKKTTENNITRDAGTTGIWQMSLTGSGKKCIYKNATLLAKYGGKLLVIASGQKFTIRTSGKKISDFQYSKNIMANTCYGKIYSSSDYVVSICNNSKGYKYSSSGGTLYRTVNGKKSKIRTFKNQTVYKIIDLDGYVWVVTQSGYSRAYVYIMKSSGKSCKKLTSFQLAGGSW